MSERDEGGQAFPMAAVKDLQDRTDGMSLRDYFAGQSIMGCCPGKGMSEAAVLEHARWAYRMADAMLEARKQ